MSFSDNRHMSWIRYLLLFVLQFCVEFSSSAQSSTEHQFKRCPVKVINFEQGLLNNETTGIITDLLGFTWVSTRTGLQRFNGHTLDNINPVVGSDTITINSPVYLFALQNGNIWISYKKGGLTYNPVTKSFQKNILLPALRNSFFPIVPLLETGEGVWCMQQDKGIVIYNKSQKSNIIVNVANINDLINSDDLINSTILTTNKHYIFIRVSHNQILQINTDDHKFKYIGDDEDIIGIGCNDEKLFMTTGTQLSDRNISTGDPEKNYSLTGIVKEQLFYSCIQPGNKGKILVSLNRKLYEFDSSLNLQNEYSTLDEDQVVPSGFVHRIYTDGLRRIWLLTNNDIRIIQDFNIPFEHYIYKNEEHNIVRCIYVDSSQKNILAGCIDVEKGNNGGIQLFDTSGNPLWEKPFMTDEVKNVSNIEKLNKKDFLVVTSDQHGFYLLNLTEKRFEKLKLPVDAKTRSQLYSTVWPNNLQRINDSTIFIASSINVFSCIFKGETIKSVTPVLPFNGNSSNIINCFIYTSDKNIWVGSNSGVVYKLQQNGIIQTLYIPGNYIIRCFAEDRSHHVWIGTDKGIYVYTNSGQLMKTIDIQTGLLNDYIYAMLPVDQYDAVFCSSKLGLSYIPLNGNIKNYTKEFGLQENEFNTESAFKTAAGKFFFGGINGITAFYPFALSEVKDNPILNITRLIVDDSLYDFSSQIWRNDSIILNYNQNHLQFDIAALGLLNTDEYEYRYRLKGFEENWQETHRPTDIKYVLPPGTYSLLINCAPIFSSSSIIKKTITIIISPPWWQTWWFRIATAILIIGIIFLIVYEYNRRKYLSQIRSLQTQQQIQTERERISRDLHDSLGAYAASITSNIEHISIADADDNSSIALDQLRSNSQSIVSQLGDTIWALKKDALSLTALSDRIKVFAQKIHLSYPGIKIELSEQISNDRVLPSSHAFHLLQIIQEAINNSLRHSQCNLVTIFIEGTNEWKIIIADNGRGMPPGNLFTDKGNGLSNMISRANEAGWKINWELNHPTGTRVIIQSSTTN